MAKLKTGRHSSAIKAQRQAERRALRNRVLRKQARQTAKDVQGAVAAKDSKKAQELLAEAASSWDKAAKRGVVHWKTAARKKSRLAAQIGKLSAAA